MAAGTKKEKRPGVRTPSRRRRKGWGPALRAAVPWNRRQWRQPTCPCLPWPRRQSPAGARPPRARSRSPRCGSSCRRTPPPWPAAGRTRASAGAAAAPRTDAPAGWTADSSAPARQQELREGEGKGGEENKTKTDGREEEETKVGAQEGSQQQGGVARQGGVPPHQLSRHQRVVLLLPAEELGGQEGLSLSLSLSGKRGNRKRGVCARAPARS